MALDDRYLQSSESTVHRVCLSPKSDATSFTRLLVAPEGSKATFFGCAGLVTQCPLTSCWWDTVAVAGSLPVQVIVNRRAVPFSIALLLDESLIEGVAAPISAGCSREAPSSVPITTAARSKIDVEDGG